LFLSKLKNKILVLKNEVFDIHNKLANFFFNVINNIYNNIYLDKKLKIYLDELNKKIHNKNFQEKSLNELENTLGIKLNKELINFSNNKKFVESVINQLDFIKTNIKINDYNQYEISNLFEGFVNKFKLDFETVKGRYISEMIEKIIKHHYKDIENIKNDYENEYHNELMKIIQVTLTQLLSNKYTFMNKHKDLLIELSKCNIILHLDSLTNERSETLIYHIMNDYFMNLPPQYFLNPMKKDIFMKIIKETYEKHSDNLKNKIKPIMLTYDESIKDDEKKIITDEVIKKIIMNRN